MNPGNLADSRALRVNTPTMLVFMSMLIIRPLRPFLRFMDPTMRTAAEAAADVIDLTMAEAYAGERGYFTLLQKDESAPESRHEKKQEELWVKSAEWVKVAASDAHLKTGLEEE